MSIPREDMGTLQAASAVKAIAQNSEKDAQIASIAYSINNAANTGEFKVKWLGNMLDEVKTELSNEGYEVDLVDITSGGQAQNVYVISFENAE